MDTSEIARAAYHRRAGVYIYAAQVQVKWRRVAGRRLADGLFERLALVRYNLTGALAHWRTGALAHATTAPPQLRPQLRPQHMEHL